MAAKKAIISTSKGALGIQCKHERDILIANTKEEFIGSIKRCVEDFSFVKKLGENAKEFISQKHNTKILIRKLVDFYSNLLSSQN